MRTFLAAALLLIAGGAEAASQDLTLKFQHSARLAPDGPWVKFVGFEDTRCPVDVNCGVAGRARVLLLVEGSGRKPEVVLLEGGLGDPAGFDETEMARLARAAPVHRGHRFVLLTLEPRPRTAARLDPFDLVVRVRVETVGAR